MAVMTTTVALFITLVYLLNCAGGQTTDAWSNVVSMTTDGPMFDNESTTLDFNNISGSSVNGSMREALGQFWQFHVALGIYKIWPFIAFFLGLICNGLSFVVFLQRPLRKFPSYLYLAVLAVFDQLSLFWNLLAMISEMMNTEIISHSFCKALPFLQTCCIHVSVWLIVLVTLERLIVTVFPLEAGSFCTRFRAFIAMAIVGVVFFFVDMHLFWGMDVAPPPGAKRCGKTPAHVDFFGKWVWIDISLYSFVPTLILICFNTTIIVFMRMSNQRVKRISTMRKHEPRGLLSTQITILLLFVTTVFLICTVPPGILFIYRHTSWEKQFNNPEEYVTFIYVNQILNFFYSFNHIFNFLLYAISGKRFRVECKKILTCTWTKAARKKASMKAYTKSTLTKSRSKNSSYHDKDSISEGKHSKIVKSISQADSTAGDVTEPRDTTVTSQHGVSNPAFDAEETVKTENGMKEKQVEEHQTIANNSDPHVNGTEQDKLDIFPGESDDDINTANFKNIGVNCSQDLENASEKSAASDETVYV